MALALLPLLLAIAAPEASAAPTSRVQVTAMARAEIVVPVTNDPRAGSRITLRVVSQTRDGRQFVEFQ